MRSDQHLISRNVIGLGLNPLLLLALLRSVNVSQTFCNSNGISSSSTTGSSVTPVDLSNCSKCALSEEPPEVTGACC